MEEGGERWSKPHVATLSLHSLFELKKCIEKGTIMLDLEASTLPQVVGKTASLIYSQPGLRMPILVVPKQDMRRTNDSSSFCSSSSWYCTDTPPTSFFSPRADN